MSHRPVAEFSGFLKTSTSVRVIHPKSLSAISGNKKKAWTLTESQYIPRC